MMPKSKKKTKKDRKAKLFEDGKRVYTHTGKLNASRKAGRKKNPGWNTREPR